MDPVYFIYLLGLVAPIFIAIVIGLLISGLLIRKRHTVAGIVASLITSPSIILLLLLAFYLFIVFQIQEMDRVMPHAPERDMYYEGYAMFFGVAVTFALIDAVTASVVTFSLSLLHVLLRAITSDRTHKPELKI